MARILVYREIERENANWTTAQSILYRSILYFRRFRFRERVTTVRRRDFHASCTGSQQADYTSGQPRHWIIPHPLIPPSDSLARDYRPKKLKTAIVSLQRHSITLTAVLSFGISKFTVITWKSGQSWQVICNWSLRTNTASQNNTTGYTRTQAYVPQKFIADFTYQDANIQEPATESWEKGQHPARKSATRSRSSGQSGPERKIPFVDSSPSEPKD